MENAHDKKYGISIYERWSLRLLLVGIVTVGLYFGRSIVLPFAFAALLASLLLPIQKHLLSRRLPKVLATLIPVASALILLSAVIYFLSTQAVHFFDDAPALEEKFNEVIASVQRWINEATHITVSKQKEYIEETVEGIKDNGPQILGTTFGSITNVMTYIVLLPVYAFLTLYYKDRIKDFLVGVCSNGSKDQVREIISESSAVAHQYLTGLLIETFIVFALNTIGFLILGIKYPIFLALFAALLNLVPYVGMLVANIFCMLITLVSSDSITTVIWVGVVLAIVQFIDNNFGMPLIVGTKVRINALATILGIVIGGALCGIPGMFLSIPALAVLKVIFDKVPEMNPWGLLLGDEISADTSAAKKARLALSKVKRKSRK